MRSVRRHCLVASALLLAGCAANEHNDLREFVSQSEAGLRGKVETLPLPASQETLAYAAFDEPDPFSPRRTRAPAERKVVGQQWTPPASKEALESYPLESLQMVGTVERDRQLWALIRTPDNTVHRVTRGSRLGENFGAVATIDETSVTLNEHVEDGSGLWTERVASLALVEEPKAN